MLEDPLALKFLSKKFFNIWGKGRHLWTPHSWIFFLKHLTLTFFKLFPIHNFISEILQPKKHKIHFYYKFISIFFLIMPISSNILNSRLRASLLSDFVNFIVSDPRLLCNLIEIFLGFCRNFPTVPRLESRQSMPRRLQRKGFQIVKNSNFEFEFRILISIAIQRSYSFRNFICVSFVCKPIAPSLHLHLTWWELNWILMQKLYWQSRNFWIKKDSSLHWIISNLQNDEKLLSLEFM